MIDYRADRLSQDVEPHRSPTGHQGHHRWLSVRQQLGITFENMQNAARCLDTGAVPSYANTRPLCFRNPKICSRLNSQEPRSAIYQTSDCALSAVGASHTRIRRYRWRAKRRYTHSGTAAASQYSAQLHVSLVGRSRQYNLDKLTHNSFDHTMTLSENIFHALYDRQRRLRNLRVDETASISTWLTPNLSRLSTMTTLQLILCEQVHAESYHELLRRMEALNHLELRFDVLYYHRQYNRNFRMSEPNRTALSEAVLSALFGHSNRQRTMLTLRSLRLRNFDLATSVDCLLQAVDFGQLTTLALEYCRSWTLLLGVIIDTGIKCVRLEELVVTTGADQSVSTSDNLLNKYLGTCKSIEALVLHNCPHQRHPIRLWPESSVSATENLRFFYNDTGEILSDMVGEEPTVLLRRYIRLEQLAIHGPLIRLGTENFDTKLRNFCVSPEYMKRDAETDVSPELAERSTISQSPCVPDAAKLAQL